MADIFKDSIGFFVHVGIVRNYVRYAVVHQLVQNFIAGIAVICVNDDVCVRFLVVYSGAEVHKIVVLFFECLDIKNVMRLIEVIFQIAFQKKRQRPVLADYFTWNCSQFGAYSAEDSGVFFSGYE